MVVTSHGVHETARRVQCEWCGGDVIPNTVCPRSIECPQCHQGPGKPCKRPSGHRAAALHDSRIRLAEEG